VAAKGDLRAAAERLERGIERYGEGDLVAAAVEFEEALKASPEHPRARQYLSWVKDVLAGKRGAAKKKELDEDAVRAVTEALDIDEPAAEGAWTPAPLTPANPAPQPPFHTIPYGLEEAIAARGTAPTEMAIVKPSEILPTPAAVEPQPALEDNKTPSSPTILGIAPPREPALRPVGLDERRPMPSDEPPESVTREFSRPTPTLHNIAPLDVPELTEEQVAELISLESSLPTTGPGGRSLGPDIAATPDLPTEQRPTFIEFEAEATPVPHRAHSLHAAGGPAGDGGRTLSDGARQEDPSLKLQPLPFASDFESPEMTPTHARVYPLPRELVNPLPVDEDLGHSGDEEVTQNPTNPFIRQRLADYAHVEPSRTGDDELAGVPTGRRPAPKPSISDIMVQAKRVLSNGDAQTAIDIADDVVTSAGGVDAESCLPYLSLLETIYTAMIGSPDQVPRHGSSVPDLDPRAAFLLSRIDGSLSVDDLLEVSGMPRLEAMRVLALLIRHGAVVTG
jgi:hypothetical protein